MPEGSEKDPMFTATTSIAEWDAHMKSITADVDPGEGLSFSLTAENEEALAALIDEATENALARDEGEEAEKLVDLSERVLLKVLHGGGSLDRVTAIEFVLTAGVLEADVRQAATDSITKKRGDAEGRITDFDIVKELFTPADYAYTTLKGMVEADFRTVQQETPSDVLIEIFGDSKSPPPRLLQRTIYTPVSLQERASVFMDLVMPDVALTDPRSHELGSAALWDALGYQQPVLPDAARERIREFMEQYPTRRLVAAPLLNWEQRVELNWAVRREFRRSNLIHRQDVVQFHTDEVMGRVYRQLLADPQAVLTDESHGYRGGALTEDYVLRYAPADATTGSDLLSRADYGVYLQDSQRGLQDEAGNVWTYGFTDVNWDPNQKLKGAEFTDRRPLPIMSTEMAIGIHLLHLAAGNVSHNPIGRDTVNEIVCTMDDEGSGFHAVAPMSVKWSGPGIDVETAFFWHGHERDYRKIEDPLAA